MGCDIHLMAEKRVFNYNNEERGNGKWVNIDKWVDDQDFYKGFSNKKKLVISYDDRFYTGRNYNLFCALAGVRSNCFNDDPNIVSKPKGMPKDCSMQVKKERKDWGSDGHSDSWLTLTELKSFNWQPYGNTCDEFVKGTIPKLEAQKDHDSSDDDIRIVFWFDN